MIAFGCGAAITGSKTGDKTPISGQVIAFGCGFHSCSGAPRYERKYLLKKRLQELNIAPAAIQFSEYQPLSVGR